MSVSFEPETGVFFLSTKHTSYSFRIFDKGYLVSLYYGRAIRPVDLTRLWRTSSFGFSPGLAGEAREDVSLDVLPTEYPVYGCGDFRSPALSVEFPTGSRLLDLTYRSHRVTAGTAEPQGLPGLSGGDQTLVVTLEDVHTGLQAELWYAVYEESDVIARHARIRNATGGPVRITRALSASLELPDSDWEMISLYGSHCRERNVERSPLRHGVQAIGSRRGASSHHHNPFLALAAPSATEFAGEAYGLALVYSGNFLAQAEVAPFDTTRVQMGIHPDEFSWLLEKDEVFVTPEAMLTYTDGGLNRLSQNLHRVMKEHLGHAPYRRRPRPIVINNWEATYFDFNEEKLLAIIDSCAGLGIDTFVLDDGWFGRRDDDTTSLGDWFIDARKLPRGLSPLIERCESLGMTFGLWFEPEMISPDSELYRAHPDWCIGQPGRPYCLSRHQRILDLSRDDVLEYLKRAVGDILEKNRISYVKWDMNRHMTDAYSAALPPERQGEIFHRYMLHLYDLMGYLTRRFPSVLFEGCSGGGGRFDAGMLYYHPQIWTSDDSDAIERLKIQYGTSLAYPPQAMTAHVSACPNHQVGRTTPFHTRGLVAMSASFGYELNPLLLSEEEREQIKEQTARYHALGDLVTDGDFYRLRSPFEGNDCGWMFVSPDKARAVAVYVRMLTTPDNRARLKLAGLDEAARYRIEELDASFGGDELLYAGLAVPPLRDFEAVSFTLARE